MVFFRFRNLPGKSFDMERSVATISDQREYTPRGVGVILFILLCNYALSNDDVMKKSHFLTSLTALSTGTDF